MKKRMIDIIFIIIGVFFFVLGVNLFVILNEFGEGGVIGIMIIMYYLFEWLLGLVNLILNVILLIVGYKFLNKIIMIYMIIVVVMNLLFFYLIEGWMIILDEMLVNVIFGGIFIGCGIGFIICVGGMIVGIIILVRMIYKYLGWSISYGLLFFDLIVVFLFYFIIGVEKLMLIIIMLYVGMKVMEFVIEGLNLKKVIIIIFDNLDEIVGKVIILMGRGVIVYLGYGYYMKMLKDILYVVINK